MPYTVFHDIDGDNDYDLFVGTDNGQISFYKNNGNRFSAYFELITNSYANIDIMDNAKPVFAQVQAGLLDNQIAIKLNNSGYQQ
jgi:hypothetical protein